MRISAADRSRVCEAIRDAESATTGEFVCVLARSASAYRFYPLAWATLAALAVPWLLVVATDWTVQAILLGQLITFALSMLLLSCPPLRRHIVPKRVRRAVAHRAAAEQFLVRGLAHTPHRRGILLYVAEEEHEARVLADDGLASVPRDQWQAAIDRLVAQSRQGRHADGFVEALAHCATVLRQGFPAEQPRRKVLPDRFYLVD